MIREWLNKREENKRKKDAKRFAKWVRELDRMYDELPDDVKNMLDLVE